MKHVGMRIKVLAKRAKASRAGRLHFSPGESNTLTAAASRKTMLSEKKRKRTGLRRPGCPQGRKKADRPQRAAEMESADSSVLRPLCRPCRMDLLVTQVRRRRLGIILRSSRSRESTFFVREVTLGPGRDALFDSRSLHRP